MREDIIKPSPEQQQAAQRLFDKTPTWTPNDINITQFELATVGSLETRNEAGRTWLHLAVLANNLDLVRHLLYDCELHSNVNALDQEGQTPLDLCSDAQNEMADLLQQAGAVGLLHRKRQLEKNYVKPEAVIQLGLEPEPYQNLLDHVEEISKEKPEVLAESWVMPEVIKILETSQCEPVRKLASDCRVAYKGISLHFIGRAYLLGSRQGIYPPMPINKAFASHANQILSLLHIQNESVLLWFTKFVNSKPQYLPYQMLSSDLTLALSYVQLCSLLLINDEENVTANAVFQRLIELPIDTSLVDHLKKIQPELLEWILLTFFNLKFDVGASTKNTLLHFAAALGLEELFKQTCVLKPPLDQQNQNGNTPLMLAIQHNPKNSGFVNLIIEEMAKAGIDFNAKNAQGKTALVLALDADLHDSAALMYGVGAAADPQIQMRMLDKKIMLDKVRQEAIVRLLQRLERADQQTQQVQENAVMNTLKVLQKTTIDRMQLEEKVHVLAEQNITLQKQIQLLLQQFGALLQGGPQIGPVQAQPQLAQNPQRLLNQPAEKAIKWVSQEEFEAEQKKRIALEERVKQLEARLLSADQAEPQQQILQMH